MTFPPLLFKVRPPQEVTPVIGSSVRLPCVAESDLRTKITWTKDGMSLLPVESRVLQNRTLLITNIKILHLSKSVHQSGLPVLGHKKTRQ